MKVAWLICCIVATMQVSRAHSLDYPVRWYNSRLKEYSITRQQYEILRMYYYDRSIYPPTTRDCQPSGALFRYGLKFCENAVEAPELLKKQPPLEHTWVIKGRKREIHSGRSRRPRAVPGNPCSASASIPSYFYYGVLSGTTTTVEIVQDLVNGHFQLFFAFPCISASYNGDPCQPSGNEYIAEIYTGNGYETTQAQIEVATACNIFVGG